MDAPDDVIGPINLGNPGEFSINDLAQQVIAMTRSSSPVETCPLPQDDPMQRCPDIGRAHTLLDWQPKIALEAGLKRTIDYFARVT